MLWYKHINSQPDHRPDCAAGSLSIANNGLLAVPHLELLPRKDKHLLLEHMQTTRVLPPTVFAAYEPRRLLTSIDKGMIEALEVSDHILSHRCWILTVVQSIKTEPVDMALIRQFDLVVPLVAGTAADDAAWADFLLARSSKAITGEFPAKVSTAASTTSVLTIAALSSGAADISEVCEGERMPTVTTS